MTKHTSFDPLFDKIADYVLHYNNFSPLAMQTARSALLDSIGCAILALSFPECEKRLAPFFSGQRREGGFHLPGTDRILDPVSAAFSLGAQIRWL
ncbi:MAG: MmgE/PrpD family protein, partial [Chlamydiia bacterium]|nr:MmgE/PrpD family protein [Chlamydiia bacterium]